MIIKECCTVEEQIEKGKGASGFITLSCNCLFFHQYLLPYRHIFHKDMYSFIKLLTPDVWEKF